MTDVAPSSPYRAEPERARPWTVPVFTGVMLLAALLRIPGLFTDFWLDEIWTLTIVETLDSPLDIVTKVRHSNNHHLNTLVFYLLGEQDHWIAYRIHALLAGLGAVALAWLIAARFGRLEKVLAAGLTAVSYLAVHFSSEARGYSAVVFFAFLTFWGALRFVDRRDWASAVIVWTAACLGWLSHLAFAHFFAALVLWLPFRLWQTSETGARAVRGSVTVLGVPFVFAGLFYLAEVRNIIIHGAPEYAMLDVIVKSLSLAGGGPAAGPWAFAVGAVTALIFSGSVVWMARRGEQVWPFFALVIFLVPATLLVVLRPDVLFVRYFVVSIGFGLIAAAVLLGGLLRSGSLPRVAAVVLLAAFVVGNAVNLAAFYRHGRGAYRAGLLHIVQTSPGGVTTLGSDHDFRNGTVIDYYRRFLPPGERIEYIDHARYPAGGPDWIVLHRIGALGEVHESIDDSLGNTFLLQKVLPYSDLSGWHWLLYRRK
jgi:hypothetical protein